MFHFSETIQKQARYENIIGFMLIAFTALLCVLPLLIHRTLLISHDINFHIFQADQFYRSIASGEIFPNWTLSSNNGYGGANFMFYSPLSYYFMAMFHLFLPSTVQSMIVAIWCSFFLSGLTMYLTVKKFSGFALGLSCAILYQIFPYHIIDLYLRGAYAELFAFIWFPLIIHFIHDILDSKADFAALIGLSISYAGLILTHLVSGFIFSLIILAYLLYLYIKRMDPWKTLYVFGSLLLGLGFSSFFLIPVIFERKFVQIEYIYHYAFSDYRKNFLFLPENLHGNPGKFYLPLHVAVLAEVVLFLLILIVQHGNYSKSFAKVQIRMCISLFLVAFFMTTPLSRWVWEFIPGLQATQFPWRWVVFMELPLIYLVTAHIKECAKHDFFAGGIKNRCFIYLILMLTFISVSIISCSNEKIPANELSCILNPMQSGYYANLPKEYTPVWATDLEKLLILPAPQRVSIISGNAVARISHWLPEKRTIDINVNAPAVLRVATFFYPGWVAESAGRKRQIRVEENTGVMLINLPKGNHMLTLKFIDTPMRRLAKCISLFSCLIIVVSAGVEINKRKNSVKTEML